MGEMVPNICIFENRKVRAYDEDAEGKAHNSNLLVEQIVIHYNNISWKMTPPQSQVTN